MPQSSGVLGTIVRGTGVRSFSWLGLVLALLLCLLGAPHPSWGAPFARYLQFTQPDQTEIRIWGQGDEFHAVFETVSGYTVVFDPQAKAYFYAKLSSDGKGLLSTGVMAHYPVPEGLAKHLRIDPTAAAADARAKRKQWDDDMELSKRWNRLKAKTLGTPLPPDESGPLPAPPDSTTVGSKVGLTLLIDFSDAPATISQLEISSFLNGDTYTGYGNNGSVKKYFSDVSGGRLTYTNVVTIYVRMNQPKSYYNDTSQDQNCGTQGRLLINDALAILKARSDYASTILPTFNSLTTDGSGNVLAFNVYFAGGDSGAWMKGLWPHSWLLAAPIPLGNGKSVSRYQITNVGDTLTLGTFCHENGHMLCGFPDLYDYDYDAVGGAGKFSIMGSGGEGTNPSQVDAYLKLAAGWATVTDLTGSSSLTGTLVAAPTSGYDNFYRYRRDGVATEYFLLENRQKTGRDADLPAAGIAVWHVDELGNRDNQSLTPNSTHANYELTLVQADNLWHFETTTNNAGDVNDLYYLGNGAAGYTNALDDSSAPNANWWDGTASGMRLNTFSVIGQSMTFQTAPPALAVTSTVPAASATGVAVNTAVKATFNRAMNASTITTSTFYLDNGVTGTVSYDPATKTATFTPSASLANNTSYTATVTTGVTDAAGNHLPEAKVWAFTTVGANLFANGGFENGATGWTQSSTTGYSLIYTDGWYSHTGNGYAYLGGFSASTDILYQVVSIPANASAASLRLWYKVYSWEHDYVNVWDTLTLTVNNPATGAVIQTLGALSNVDDTNFSWVQTPPIDLTPFKGQTFRLTFTSVQDYSEPTEFYLDDITLDITIPVVMRSLAVNFPGTGSGTVTISPGNIVCNTNYVGQFEDGTALSLTGAATDYSDFGGWTGDCTSSPCNLTMNANRSVNANFALDTVHKARIGSNYFSTLPAAYGSPAGTTIQAWGTYFSESLTCNQAKAVTIDGGYNDGYSAKSGYTLLLGPLTISSGSLTVRELAIK